MSHDRLHSLRRDIESCMLIDQPRLRAGLRRLEQGGKLDTLQREIQASITRRQSRTNDTPTLIYPEELPVVERRLEIASAIRDHQVVVLCGETGSGKTTQLPKLCLELGRGTAGLIGHTQPRRIAGRTIAARIADELRSPLGKYVGYKIRFGDTVSETSHIKVMTDGILLAETRSDPLLLQYDTIIVDEAHERSLNIDFLLGYLKRLLPRRPDLKLIITSATIDPQRFSEHFASPKPAPIVEVSGRTYPVDVRYRPLVSESEDAEDRDLRQGVLDAVDEAIAEGPGDILVFLSGEREIREIATALVKHQRNAGTEVLPLYARLSAAEQNRVFATTNRAVRRIILATNVAETSLTVPGIRYVVDAGYARISRYAARSGVQRLPIEAISRASADQRKGRCGRLGPGICFRLYSEDDFRRREEFTPPEIVRTNLASVILQMKALKLGKIEDFPFIEPPRWGMITDGYNTLHELGALDEWGEITAIGESLAKLPIDPRLGRILLAAREEGCLSDALVIAAALSIQDPRERPHDRRDAADEAHRRFHDEDSDFVTLLNLWRFHREHREAEGMNERKLRKLYSQHYLSFVRMREWEDVLRQLRELIAEAEVTTHETGRPRRGKKRRRSTDANDEATKHDPLHRAVLAGFLSHIGIKGEGHEYTGAHGRKFHIFPGSAVFKRTPQWIVAAELIETTRLYAHNVARISSQWIERLAPHLVKRRYAEPFWRERPADVGALETVTLFGIEIVRNRRVAYGPIDPKASREIFIHALVEGRCRSAGPFWSHNQKLVEEIRQFEEMTRRRGVLADDAHQYAFYDARVPEGIFSGAAFEAWRVNAEEAEPRLLFMTRELLLADDAHGATADRFPSHLIVNAASLPLAYRFEPGHEDDGVTVTAPVAIMHQLTRERLDWLVPGLIEDKIAAMIRTLPKSIRRHFVPAPQIAAACAERLRANGRYGEGSLFESVGRALHAMTGIEVPRKEWDAAAIPAHLCMNINVVDDAGTTIVKGRDLDAIRMTVHGADVAKSRRSHIQAPSKSVQASHLPTGKHRSWDFGELAEQVVVRRAGIEMTAFPAIVDEGDGVTLRPLESKEIAEAATRAGLRRLIMLQHRDEMSWQRSHMPHLEQSALYGVSLGLGDGAALREQALQRAIDKAFLRHQSDIRDRKTFERAVQAGWEQWQDAVESVCRLADTVLSQAHTVKLRLDEVRTAQFREPHAEMTEQLQLMVHRDFLTTTPPEWLEQLPRYLRGMSLRIDKLRGGKLARDRALAADFNILWKRCVDQLRVFTQQGTVHAALTRHRWLLEELRVSLFAQEIGAIEKVSIKRLEEHWAQHVAV
ncbi:MAG TPA: ATP-dependent RNA helicase HrpA [Phycisphaerales bacterium]|nr:ATP-dependent RNA helicase HrpA [Phycisphaerales bacterium]